jgi:beta-lactamase class A
MNKFAKAIGLIAVSLVPFLAHAQQNELRQQIVEFSKPTKGIVGVSVLGLEDRDTLNVHGNAKLVLQSVMKMPIAMAVLHLVDSGVVKLDQKIKVKKKDLQPQTFSPLRDKFPDGGEFTISDLLSYMVSQSDNNACDILLNFLGGPDQVEDYIHIIKVTGINIEASEADMAKDWPVQYIDWARPFDIVKLMDKFYTGKVLLPESRDLLLKMMAESIPGPNRIKGLLPPGTVVAHKTGTSGTNDMGLSPSTNDAGIITLPNGKHIAIAVFVCNSTADAATRDKVIANIAKAVYDYEVKR